MCIVGYRLDITNGSVPSWMPPNRPCFPPESPNIEALSLFHEKRKLSGFRKKIIGESNVRRLPLPAFCYKISESRYSYWWDFSMLVCTDKSSAFVPDKKAPANGNDGNGNIWCIDSVCWCDSAEISSLRWKNGNEAMDYVENYSLKQEICTLSTFKWNKTWIIGSISDFSYAIWKNWKVQSIWTFCTKIILSNKKYTEKNISVKQKFLFYPKEFKPSIGWNELLLF